MIPDLGTGCILIKSSLEDKTLPFPRVTLHGNSEVANKVHIFHSDKDRFYEVHYKNNQVRESSSLLQQRPKIEVTAR